MSILEKNNYGYSTALNQTYAIVGNPASFTYNRNVYGTGSVEVYKYTSTTDSYIPFISLKRITPSASYDQLLATEIPELIDTELSYDIQLDVNQVFINQVADCYGRSVAVYGSTVVVGNSLSLLSYANGSSYISESTVDVYDMESTGSVSTPIYSITNSFDGPGTTSSFGESVALYGNYVVVGSSRIYNGTGRVYIYQNNNNIYSLIQTLSGSLTTSGSLFGGIVKIDQSGSYRILVGNSATGSGNVYVFNYVSASNQWVESKRLSSDRSIQQSLNFTQFPPVTSSSNPDSYGNAIGLYGTSIVVGAPTDTEYYEYSGSGTIRNRGAVYFYTNCNDSLSDWYLIHKSYGNSELLKTNKLGWSVDVYATSSVVSSVKYNFPFTSSYIINTLLSKYGCEEDFDVTNTLGQVVIYNQDTGSNWSIVDVITKKKEYNSPYSVFGHQVAINGSKFSVGSPVILVNPSNITASSDTNIHGADYIYDLGNLETNASVGNVFYRNGKLIFSNSGSMFDRLMTDRSDVRFSKYDITYKSQLTIYEKQIICRIEPGEFNYSTNPTALVPLTFDFDIDGNREFSFIDVDLILRYISYKINAEDQLWYNYIEFENDEYSLFSFYYEKYNLSYVTSGYLTKYIDVLEAKYSLFDIDGNGKVNLNDLYILWKFFIDKLNTDVVFRYVDIKSTRKSETDIRSYIGEKTGASGRGVIRPEFFYYDYSSSVDVTGSYLAPFITSVGLYSGADLVAIAKLGTPLKNGGEFPVNILVKWDI